MPSKRPRSSRRQPEGRPRKATPVASHPWRHSVRPFLLLWALAGLLYANSVPNQFVFDDHVLVDFNADVNPAVAGAIEHRSIDYRPLRILSYVLDREIGGHRPASYHIGNIVYHALAGSVALVTYGQLGLSPATALLAAALFVAHPAQTESVAYISGRRDVLCGLFTLLAFSLYLRWRRERRQWWNLTGSVVSLVIAALTKEVAFVFPFLVVAYDVTVTLAQQRATTPGGSFRSDAVAILRRQRAAYVLLVLLGLAGIAYFAIGGLPTRQPWWGGTPVTNFLNVALLWVHSGVLMLFPIRLLADYSYEAVPLITTAASPLAWAAAAALLALLAVSLWQLRRAPVAVFLLWWVALALLPSSHVIPHHDFWAEHYLYLPLFGFAGLLALLVTRLARRLGWTSNGFERIGLLLVLLYGARTVIRNRDWRDDLTLWRVTSAAAPRCARAHANHAGALLAQQDIASAEPEFEAALAIEPNQLSALSGMVMIDHAKGNLAARDDLLRRLERNPRTSYTNLLSLAGWFLINKEYAVAIDIAQQIVGRGQGDDRLWTVEGWARAGLGQLDQACPLFEKALRRNPSSGDALAGRNFCRQHAGPGPDGQSGEVTNR